MTPWRTSTSVVGSPVGGDQPRNPAWSCSRSVRAAAGDSISSITDSSSAALPRTGPGATSSPSIARLARASASAFSARGIQV